VVNDGGVVKRLPKKYEILFFKLKTYKKKDKKGGYL
jgi:hypothetical protein